MCCPGNLEDPGRFRFQVSPDKRVDGVAGQGAGGGSPLSPCPIDVPTEILKPQCATPLCHDADGAANAGGLLLDGENVLDELLGVPVGTDACRNAGWEMRVDRGTSGMGLMLHLLSESHPDCSRRMPPGSPPLDAYQYECVRRWLENALYDYSRRRDSLEAEGDP